MFHAVCIYVQGEKGDSGNIGPLGKKGEQVCTYAFNLEKACPHFCFFYCLTLFVLRLSIYLFMKCIYILLTAHVPGSSWS